MFYYFFNSYELSQAIKYSSIGLLFFPSSKVLLSGLNGLGEIRVYSIFQAIRSILIVVSLIFLISVKTKPYLLISTFVLTEAILFLIILSYYIYAFKLPKIKNFINHLNKIIVFGFRSFINPLLAELYPKIDIILIGFYFDDKYVGIYSIAAIFIEGLTQIPMIFTTNLNPRFSRLYKKNKKELLIKLIKKVIKNIALIIIALVSIFVGFAYLAINFYLDNPGTYNQSLITFLILGLGIIISSGYYPLQMIFNQNGLPEAYTKFYIIIIILNFILSFTLINIIGFYGASIGTALANMISILILKSFCQKKLSLQLNVKKR